MKRPNRRTPLAAGFAAWWANEKFSENSRRLDCRCSVLAMDNPSKASGLDWAHNIAGRLAGPHG